MPEPSRVLTFLLNGQHVSLDNPDPCVLLSDYLHLRGITGTKVACGQGGCGACTVMVSQQVDGKVVHRGVNACLKALCSLDGMTVTTTEGIGNVHHGLDRAQHCIAAHNGTQCGFCTPGFVMNAHALLRHKPEASEQDLEDSFGGNICRCTGYRPILHGVRTLAADYDAARDGTAACLIDPTFPIQVRSEPVAIETLAAPEGERYFHSPHHEWFRPTSLAEARRLKAQLVQQHGAQAVKLVVGNTAIGIYAHEKPRFHIDVSQLPELTTLEELEDGILAGASVVIQDLIDFAEAVIARRPAEQTTGLRELVRHGKRIAGRQVRSAGSLAGNVAITTGHALQGEPFPSDLFVILTTLGTRVTMTSRVVDMLDIPLGDLPAEEMLESFFIPYSQAGEFIQTHRVARRKQNSHPLVNAGFRLRLDEAGRVEHFSSIFGGLTRMLRPATGTGEWLVGNPLGLAALKVLEKELSQWEIIHDEEAISAAYRLGVARNFFFKFLQHVQGKPAGEPFQRPLSRGVQTFSQDPEMFPVTQPILKQKAFVQASGEVKFTQDIPLPLGGLHAVMVWSQRAHAKFSLAPSLSREARSRFAGFRDFVTAADVPGQNLIGLGDDDPVFSQGVVTSVGAPIGLAVADSLATARAAADWIGRQIAYLDLPAVLTLDQAIEQNTALPQLQFAKDPDEDIQQRIPTITRPGSDEAWLKNPGQPLPGTAVVRGQMRVGAQAQFYLETMCALAVPGAYHHMTVYSSTQNPNGDQRNIARALGVKVNQISVCVDQIGGGFGGKQHRSGMVGAAAAVAARKLGKPIRLLYDRATDMAMVGKRHPYLGNYSLAFTPEGLFQGYHLDVHSDAGDTYDCSFAVMDLGLMMADGCYNVPNFQSNGTVYRTNKTSNTAMRTFGTVQPYLMLEEAVEQAAHHLGIPAEELRRKNFYRSGTLYDFDRAPYGQALQWCIIRELWDDLTRRCEFKARAQAVEKFNQENRYHKRGIMMLPQKYGIGFTEPRGSLNSSSALVNINFSDGSVTVVHGAVEMGQGVHTKIAQVAAQTLGIPIEMIRIGDNHTDTIVNAPATAASTGYDLNAGAVEKCCKVLRERLQQFCRDLEQFNPHDCISEWRIDWADRWQEIVARAWLNRISLSAAELYKSPHYAGPSERHPQGHPFLYFVWGVACSEVEIDCLTGEFEVLRSDLLYDAHKSPNPAIDIGQIEGAFVQGMGYVTTEHVIFNQHGALVTDNTWTYKPPCSKTIPIDFRVHLYPPEASLDKHAAAAENLAVKSSKTTGEPSMLMGLSVWFAIRRAIHAARRDHLGDASWYPMDCPATSERIQLACGVSSESLSTGGPHG
ncbi:MAG: molybdopterin-dependent oxidoreductase [Candidatus Eremiobacteraeota bacterium]|nr:molybdopterin-dependent oxidoreductase [Candidatus Eremiobacteraeota bacterium]MCW5868574.1 molybdopterin-dependent oxidoreductase [Candidatus Eremiobacteraeota bacterium]